MNQPLCRSAAGRVRSAICPGGAGHVYVSPVRMSRTYKNRNAFTEFPPHAIQLVHPHPLAPAPVSVPMLELAA